MTGGVVVVLGGTGRNACAGMTGGTAYLLDDGSARAALNTDSVVAEVGEPDESLADLLRQHLARTGSPRARQILQEWPASAERFVKVRARETRREPGA